MEQLEAFLEAVLPRIHPAPERARAEAILLRWGTAWQGPARSLEATRSIHGIFLHFNQRLGGVWSQAFGFRLTSRHGLALRGPDPDRARKAHKLRAHKLERAPLDALFEAWSLHPEAHPAGNAVEFLFDETPDDTWEACLREALACLKG